MLNEKPLNASVFNDSFASNTGPIFVVERLVEERQQFSLENEYSDDLGDSTELRIENFYED